MKKRTCAGCDTEFEIGKRERNPRRWCTPACRAWCHNHPGEQRDTSPRSCDHCGLDIGHRAISARYCDRTCAFRYRLAQRREYPLPSRCEWCDNEYEKQRGNHRHCSTSCSMAQYRADHPEKYEMDPEYRRAFDQRRRAWKKNNGDHELVYAREVFDRDDWQCHICGEPVEPALSWPDPRSPSLDHVVPLSKGGEHSYANVKCSHLRCNVAKGSRVKSSTPPPG